MSKLKCPYCNKVSEFEDTGVGWKCPECSGKVFTKYKDSDGIVHRYGDPTIERKRLMDESHIYDLDAMDTMVGVTEPGPFYSPTFGKLVELADRLDRKGFIEEANAVDRILKWKDPYTKPLKDQTYVEKLPQDYIHSRSRDPLPNL